MFGSARPLNKKHCYAICGDVFVEIKQPEQKTLEGVSQPPYASDDSIVLQGVRCSCVTVLIVDLEKASDERRMT